MADGELRGRVALVTGASRRGAIGAAICRALAERGADIFFTHWRPFDATQPAGIDADGPAALAQELQALGVRCDELETDLRDPDAPQRVLDSCAERRGPPTILVNNAAYSRRAGYDTLDAATLDAHYRVNIRGATLLSVLFARGYTDDGNARGRIVNLTSGQSLGPMVGELAYIATKGAVEALTVTLAAELAGRGITVNAIDPGPTDSGWMTAEVRQELLALSSRGRLGLPADAARLVAFLASDEAAWISGQIIHSRGGFA